MNSRNIWILGFALFLLAFLWAISDILLPFIVGLVLAYLLDPVADFLESAGCPRWLGAAILAFGAIFLAVGVFIFFAPILLQQFIDFIEQAPNYIEKLRIAVGPIITNLRESWPIFDQVSLAEKMSEAYGPHAINWVGDLTRTFWAGGLAALNFLSLVIITPIVLFYLLRDWDRLVALLIDLIPKPHSKIIKNIFFIHLILDFSPFFVSFIRFSLLLRLSLLLSTRPCNDSCFDLRLVNSFSNSVTRVLDASRSFDLRLKLILSSRTRRTDSDFLFFRSSFTVSNFCIVSLSCFLRLVSVSV